MNDLPTDLVAWHEQIWRELIAAAANRRDPAHFPVLATAGRAGGARARMIGLRNVDPGRRQLTAYSDLAAAKIAELGVDPDATLLFWDAERQQQLRMHVSVISMDSENTQEVWNNLPEPARAHYGRMPAPGTVISTPEAWEPAPDPASFAMLVCQVREIDVLRLDPDIRRHRRARFAASDGWRGAWLVP